MKYTVIYEKTGTGYSAYPPDLPGCGASGPTLEVTRQRIEEVIEAHIRGMLEDGMVLPEPSTLAETVEV